MSDSEQGDENYTGSGEYDATQFATKIEFDKPDPNEDPETGIVHKVTVLGKRQSRPPQRFDEDPEYFPDDWRSLTKDPEETGWQEDIPGCDEREEDDEDYVPGKLEKEDSSGSSDDGSDGDFD
jgi:hypothetical protein